MLCIMKTVANEYTIAKILNVRYIKQNFGFQNDDCGKLNTYCLIKFEDKLSEGVKAKLSGLCG